MTAQSRLWECACACAHEYVSRQSMRAKMLKKLQAQHRWSHTDSGISGGYRRSDIRRAGKHRSSVQAKRSTDRSADRRGDKRATTM